MASSLGAVRLVFVIGATLFSICNACDTCNTPWTFVYQNAANGDDVDGAYKDLTAAQQRGARIRYVIEDAGYAGIVEEVDISVVYDDVFCAESTFHINKDTWNHILDDGVWRFVVVCTDGRYEQYLYSVGEHEMIDEVFQDFSIEWYVQESTCGDPILSHTEDGDVITGSKTSLMASVASGYDIKVRYDGTFIMPIANLETHHEEVIGQTIWSFYSPDNTGLEWWFQSTSTTGFMDLIFWNVGEHHSEEHSNSQQAVDWLVEPCWRHVFTNDRDGQEIDGSLADLIAAVRGGHRVKVVVGRYAMEVDSIKTKWGQVSAQVLSRVSKDENDKSMFASDTDWVWQMLSTSGVISEKRFKIGDTENTISNTKTKKIKWFVDTRRWTKVLSTNPDGDVIFGAKNELKYAVSSGSQVRIGLQPPSGLEDEWFMIKAEHLEFGPNEEIAAELMKYVSTDIIDNQFVIKDEPYWQFLVVSTESTVDVAKWRVGAHVDDGHVTVPASVNWYINI